MFPLYITAKQLSLKNKCDFEVSCNSEKKGFFPIHTVQASLNYQVIFSKDRNKGKKRRKKQHMQRGPHKSLLTYNASIDQRAVKKSYALTEQETALKKQNYYQEHKEYSYNTYSIWDSSLDRY